MVPLPEFKEKRKVAIARYSQIKNRGARDKCGFARSDWS